MIGIYTQGGRDIGLGHLRRCLTLADALVRMGARVGFVVNDDASAQQFVQAQGYAVVGLDDDLERVVSALRNWRADAVITDSYALNSADLAALRRGIGYLVVIDDLANQELPADLVTNGAVCAPSLRYCARPETRFLLGPSYALLRDEFAANPARAIRDSVERVLITVGGSDPFGLTPRLVDWVQAALGDIGMDIVAGPFFENRITVRETEQIIFHREPRDMRGLMLAADIAITGGGQTTYELAATGTPAIAICLAENQRANLTGLAEAGTLDYAGDVRDGDLEAKIAAALKSLAASRECREAMSQRGRHLVDGRGAERVARAIFEAI
ncbi:MAG: UDP-2,4-diacetamido-2,4,6-trideoxy-beta-L-altropyranose hydrolase [Chloroflexi bacterium]|nr:UDP-2,4-diacetamido-2,4,6-trideoxy-beta-L-altropyranose hydrolase [Chloroflexota bacterium]